MTNWDVFLIVAALLGFVGTMYSMFYKPTHELNIQLVKLNGNIEMLNRSDSAQNNRLDKHSETLDNHEHRITVIENTRYIKDRT